MKSQLIERKRKLTPPYESGRTDTFKIKNVLKFSMVVGFATWLRYFPANQSFREHEHWRNLFLCNGSVRPHFIRTAERFTRSIFPFPSLQHKFLPRRNLDNAVHSDSRSRMASQKQILSAVYPKTCAIIIAGAHLPSRRKFQP